MTAIQEGYTKVPNGVLEALSRVRVPGEARQVLDVIIRQTWGWNRESDTISLNQFEEKTGLDRGGVGRALRRLKAMNLIFCDKGGVKKDTMGVSKKTPLTSNYQINKDIGTWQPLERVRRGGVKKDTEGGVKKDTGNREKGVSKMPHTKERVLKKGLKKIFLSDSVEIGLAEFFIRLLEDRGYEWAKGRCPDVQKWAAEFDKLIRIDGRSPERIKAVLAWVQNDPFWKANILSPAKLREQWGKLVEKMKSENSRNNPSQQSSGPKVGCRCGTVFPLQYQGQPCPRCGKPYSSAGPREERVRCASEYCGWKWYPSQHKNCPKCGMPYESEQQKKESDLWPSG